MNSHPDCVGKIKIAAGVTAEVLAEFLEGFVGRLSYKIIVRNLHVYFQFHSLISYFQAFLSFTIFLANR